MNKNDKQTLKKKIDLFRCKLFSGNLFLSEALLKCLDEKTDTHHILRTKGQLIFWEKMIQELISELDKELKSKGGSTPYVDAWTRAARGND